MHNIEYCLLEINYNNPQFFRGKKGLTNSNILVINLFFHYDIYNIDMLETFLG